MPQLWPAGLWVQAAGAVRGSHGSGLANLPVVLIESDRERGEGAGAHVKSFDWDELKTAYNGHSVRARGMATGGNETYEPPFRGAIVISQNNPVAASDAIMQRICHILFDRSGQTPKTREAAMKLEAFPIEQVSGFILRCAKLEDLILATVIERTTVYEAELLSQGYVKSTRLAKNHAQILALADALAMVLHLDAERHEASNSHRIHTERHQPMSDFV